MNPYDYRWANRPLLCRLGIHRPVAHYPGIKKACFRCPFVWGYKIINRSWKETHK